MNAEEFWQASCALYGRPDVRDICLSLQDSSLRADVNLMLLACVLGIRHIGIEEPVWRQLADAVADWQDEVLKPLRSIRRTTKSSSQSVYERLKSAELAAERHEQELIVDILPDDLRVVECACVGENLAAYARSLNGKLAPETRHALDRLQEAVQ